MMLKFCVGIMLVFMSFFLVGCNNLEYETSRDTVIVAPDNSYSLTLKYDNVSRPCVYKDGKKLYEYQGNGFNESVVWDIKWVSDNEVLLYIKSPQKEKYKKEQIHITLY